MTEPSPALDPATAVDIGRIIGPHGIKGELRVQPLSDFANRFERGSRLWLHGTPVRVEASRWVGRLVYVKLAGINNRSAAEPLREAFLQAPEAQPLREPDVYYQHDIVGLAVDTEAGERLGRVESIFSTGANDVYVVKGERGELLLPAVDEVVKSVDIAGGRVVIDLLPGLEFTSSSPKRRLAPPPRHRKPVRRPTVTPETTTDPPTEPPPGD